MFEPLIINAFVLINNNPAFCLCYKNKAENRQLRHKYSARPLISSWRNGPKTFRNDLFQEATCASAITRCTKWGLIIRQEVSNTLGRRALLPWRPPPTAATADRSHPCAHCHFFFSQTSKTPPFIDDKFYSAAWNSGPDTQARVTWLFFWVCE